jgi:hypothetical protein
VSHVCCTFNLRKHMPHLQWFADPRALQQQQVKAALLTQLYGSQCNYVTKFEAARCNHEPH